MGGKDGASQQNLIPNSLCGSYNQMEVSGQFSKMLVTYSRISFIFSEWVHMGWIVLESLIGLVVEFD